MKNKNIVFVMCLLAVVAEAFSMVAVTKKMPLRNARSLYMLDKIKTVGGQECFQAYYTQKPCQAEVCCKHVYSTAKSMEIQENLRLLRSKYVRIIKKENRSAELTKLTNNYDTLMEYKLEMLMYGFFFGNSSKRLYEHTAHLNNCLFNKVRMLMDDAYGEWQEGNYEMTPEIVHAMKVREYINKQYQEEKSLMQDFDIPKIKELYSISLAEYGIRTNFLDHVDSQSKNRKE